MRLRYNLWGLFLLAFLIIQINLATSVHTITPTSFNFPEEVSRFYNITVNNSDPTFAANITQVNITLPSSFTFTTGTNGTDAPLNVFRNTTTVLSWTNSTGGLVLNNTIKRFWFNATATIPGSYNITVTTSNSTGSFSTNIPVTINDTTSPIINLIYPASGTSSTDTSYDFEFNSTDEGTIANCSLIIDNSIISTLTTINSTGGKNTILTSSGSFSEGIHNWSINCTDSVNNIANSSSWNFTVQAAATTDAADESSSGGSNTETTFRPTKTQLNEGYKVSVRKGSNVKLLEGHNLKVDSVTKSEVSLTLTSTPQTVRLGIGEEGKYNLDGDNTKDVYIKFEKVSGTTALIKVMWIDEQITQPPATTTQQTPQPTPEVKQETPTTQRYSPAPEPKSSYAWVIWTFATIIVLGIVALVVMKLKKSGPPRFHAAKFKFH